MKVWRMTTVAALLSMFHGCASVQEPDISSASQPGEPAEPGEPSLMAGIRSYEDGRYQEAMNALQRGLSRGLSERDQVRAHKYLAFIHCVSEEDAKCRGHFRMALTINPHFTLEPAESGHPIWGPVFRSVKEQR